MAEFESRLACVIKEDGSIARGYLVNTCARRGVNDYLITWKVPLQGGDVKTNFAGTIGSVADEKVTPGLITVSLTANPNELRVQTFNPNGGPAARSFHIACFRDR